MRQGKIRKKFSLNGKVQSFQEMSQVLVLIRLAMGWTRNLGQCKGVATGDRLPSPRACGGALWRYTLRGRLASGGKTRDRSQETERDRVNVANSRAAWSLQ